MNFLSPLERGMVNVNEWRGVFLGPQMAAYSRGLQRSSMVPQLSEFLYPATGKSHFNQCNQCGASLKFNSSLTRRRRWQEFDIWDDVAISVLIVSTVSPASCRTITIGTLQAHVLCSPYLWGYHMGASASEIVFKGCSLDIKSMAAINPEKLYTRIYFIPLHPHSFVIILLIYLCTYIHHVLYPLMGNSDSAEWENLMAGLLLTIYPLWCWVYPCFNYVVNYKYYPFG